MRDRLDVNRCVKRASSSPLCQLDASRGRLSKCHGCVNRISRTDLKEIIYSNHWPCQPTLGTWPLHLHASPVYGHSWIYPWKPTIWVVPCWSGEIKIVMSRYSCVCKRLHFESLRSGVGTSICLLILSLSHDRGCPARYTGSHYTSKLSFAQSHIFPKSGYMFLKGRLYVPKQISFKKSPK